MRFIQEPVRGGRTRSDLLRLKHFSSSFTARRFRPQQLLVGEQLLQVLRQHFLLQSQMDPSSSLAHFRETLTHGLDEPGGAMRGQQIEIRIRDWVIQNQLYICDYYMHI